MLGVIYETRCTATQKLYRGQHRCTKNCGGLTGKCRYLGSGVGITRAIAKYGREKFERRNLIVCLESWLNFYEREYIDEDWVERRDTLNFVTGGDQPTASKATWRRRCRAQKEYWSRPENRKQRSEAAIASWQDPEKRANRIAGLRAARAKQAKEKENQS